MARRKKEVKVEEEIVTPAPVEAPVEVTEIPSKAEYRKILDAYKEKYPEKWEERKERLLAKLESM